jgi:hypothetical protein
MIPSLGLSTLDQTLFNELSKPKMQAASQNASSGDLVHLSDEALQLQEANGLFGNSGTPDPLISALNPGAPNINPTNALEAVDALLLGFTPTSSPVPYSPAVLANPKVNLLA